MDKTTFYICNGVPLSHTYNHTLRFSNKPEQNNYFMQKVAHTFNDYSVIKRQNTLRVDVTGIRDMNTWGYLFFTDPRTNKRFYYFITANEYINDNTVALSIELDVIQTYMFDWQLNPCYVEREHSSTDIIGENTIDEGLDVGELVVASETRMGMHFDTVIIASSIDLGEFTNAESVIKRVWTFPLDKVLCGFKFYAVKLDNGIEPILELAEMLTRLDEEGQTDAIFSMWQYPSRLLNMEPVGYLPPDTVGNVPTDDPLLTPWLYSVINSNVNSFVTPELVRPSSLDGYTPRNNKMLQYPYSFLYAHNGQGSSAAYRYEFFHGQRLFKVKGVCTPDGVIKLIPQNYMSLRFADGANEYALTIGSFPLCSWNSDSYKLWLAQNQNQHALAEGMAIVNIAAGVATAAGGVAAAFTGAGAAVGVGAALGGLSTAAGGIKDILQQNALKADMSITPPQSKGAVSANYNVANDINDFFIQQRTVDAYHARVIDDFFTMYGYACRTVKVPNFSSRPRWNYVKTIGSNILGNLPQEDIAKINAIFDKGITFWKHTATVGDYTADNSPN